MASNDHINTDEVDRQVRAIERDHRSALTMFRDAIDRVFDPDSNVDGATKAQLLGMPSRRGFLKIGGLTVATSAILVACSTDATSSSSTTTTAQGATTTVPAARGTTPGTTAASNADAVTDATLLLTAESIEQLAIATYQTAIDSGLVKTAALGSAAKYFQAQHRDHAGLLSSAAKSMGVTATGQPNAYLNDNVVQPAVKKLTDEKGVVALALELETAAAETYALAAGILSVAGLRQAIMTIGGIEARHMAVLNHVLGQPPVVAGGFMKTDAAAPKASFIAPTQAPTAFKAAS